VIKMPNYKLTTKHVNNKRILKDVTDFVDEIINNFSIMWSSDSQRDAILEVIDEHLQDMVEQNKIEQWNVVCDRRNNKPSDVQNKMTHLDITYRQRNCFNITELHYLIQEV